MDAEVISMSWTFERKRGDYDAYEKTFVKLVKSAVDSKRAVFFGSLSDQGATVQTHELLPVGLDGVIGIGSATIYGDSAPENRLADMDFLLPGEDHKTTKGKIVKGSSFATAYASGLAAMVLYCIKAHIQLKDPEPDDEIGGAIGAAKSARGMKSVFSRLSQKHPEAISTKASFVRPYVTFGNDFKDTEEGRNRDLEKIVSQIMPIDWLRKYQE
jgi:hypothetical protein